MDSDSSRGIGRREFVTSAVAIGGSSALGACLGVEDSSSGDRRGSTETQSDPTETPSFPTGTNDPASLPRRQHAWNEFMVNTSSGRFALPQHQLILGLSYQGSVPPTAAERRQVEAALRTLERAYQWGTGGAESVGVNEGLLFTIGYAPKYFDRLGATVDGLESPETLLTEIGEDPEKADDFDAILVMNADFGSILLGAEEALFGSLDRVNGVPVESSFDGVFEIAERRTGVIGKGQPAETLDNEDIPEEATLSMGFRSAFADALPTEESMSIDEGPFEGGTTQVVVRLNTDLDSWYDQSHERRVKEMYSPAHTGEQVGETGQRLGQTSGISEEDVENIEEQAEEHGIVGHTAKTARARDDDFEQIILRRSEGVATDETGGSAFNFTSVQRSVDDFIQVRKAMNVDEYDVDVPEENHGIVDYLETVSRGTYLLPPREKRALPDPT